MRNKNTLRSVLMMAVLAFTIISCNSEDSKTGADKVSDTVTDGTWKVAYFNESGKDETANYVGYNFTFATNTTLTVSKDANSFTGQWFATKSTSDDDLFNTIFKILLSSPDLLKNLNGNFKVIENTGTSLKMKDDSQGELATKYLNFEKNAQ